MSRLSPANGIFFFPEARVVEASAGSGKTYVLVKRYIQLVLNPALALEQIPIRNVLALTFTNKAAGEMKARILESFKKIAFKELSQAEEVDILKPLGLDRDRASQKAFAAMEGIIRHYNFFQVQTIDKFINALLSGCAFQIGLTANFKIKTDPREYLQYSLDRLIDKARYQPEVLKTFERFLRHYLYLENRSGWFPKEDILAIITTLFAQSNTYGLPFKEGADTPDDIIKKKRLILEEMKSLREVLPGEAHAGFVKALDNFLTRHDKGFDIDSVSDYFARDDIPVRKGTDTPRELERLWTRIGTHLKELCRQEAYSLFNTYIQMYTQTMDGFYALAAKDDCLFLSELNKRAALLFDEDHITVEELYYRLATRFHHYLIDEFQDTSRLQWHNLERMAEEALSTGGSLFYVGDRKQAIYGFRGGDVALFDDIKQAFNAFNVRVDLLSDNWRSQKAIVEFNNKIFSPENLVRFIQQKEAYETEKNKNGMVHFNDDDIAEVKNIFGNARQSHQPGHDRGYVYVEYLDVDKKEERDALTREKLLALIADLRKRFSCRDIAVLTRGNKEVKEMTRWLLEEGIPVESERASDITENSLVQELAALLRFLNSPIDNLAFAAFILGDIFSRATGLKPEDTHRFVFGLRGRLADEKGFYLYAEFRRRYEEVWTVFLDEFFRNVGLYPLYELVITIYSRFDVLSLGHDDQGFLMHFLELVKKSEEEHKDIMSFLEHFENLQGEDLYVHVSDSDAVKVLTVHKAKGLEFPVVILPCLGIDVQIGAAGGDYQPSYVSRRQDGETALLRLKTKYLKFSEELSLVYAHEYKKAFLSELNNIYVALTRPQYELYVFIPKKIGQSFNCLKFMVPEEFYRQGAPCSYEMTKSKKTAVHEIPSSVYPDWIDYLKDEFVDADRFQNREQRLKGEVTHYALSLVGNLSDGDEGGCLAAAVEETALRFPQLEGAPAVKERLAELIGRPDLKRFFYGEGVVFNEKEMVDASGHTKRCDRLIVRQDQVWVVDFKSARALDGRDRGQVKEYQTMLRDIYPGRVIKGFLIYLDSLEVEEV
jgi:ATP-dependent exoDNAse (exonuclease V) beta subunit